MRCKQTIPALAALVLWSASAPGLRAQTVGPDYPVPPSLEYRGLYRDAELAGIFPDSKTFPDLVPSAAPPDVVAAYDAARETPGFDLAGFVGAHLSGPTPAGPSVSPAAPGQGLLDYVSSLWPALQQSTTAVPAYSTLLPLPYPYVVPGGRFREIYYWDSYFTMLGLEVDGRNDIAVNMLNAGVPGPAFVAACGPRVL